MLTLLKAIFLLIAIGFVMVVAGLLILKVILWCFETLAKAGGALFRGDDDPR